MDTPILFSQHFGIEPEALDQAGLLDPFLSVDLPLFIDPLLLEKSTNKVISTDGVDCFRLHFEQLVRLLAISEQEGDPAWRAAEKHLSLREPPENGLGYGRRGRSGSSRPARVRTALLRTVKAIIRLGSKDPEMLSLMGFLEEEVGPDTISDFTTRAMTDALSKITNEFCLANEIPVRENSVSSYELPMHLSNRGKDRPLILVPRDVVRHLPMTDSWRDVWEATEHNRALRERVSVLLAGIVEPTIREQKWAVREAVMQSAAVFDEFLRSIKNAAGPYDENSDIFGFYALRDLLAKRPDFGPRVEYDLSKGPEEVRKVVLDALHTFKHHVENGNLWEALWANGKPKRERASQLIFYAIADAHCRANGVDLSSEPNMGGGPVDFKFSRGFYARVLVEMKRSGGTVEHGYEKQLEFYKAASQTEYAVFVVIDYGDAGRKILQIQRMRELQLLQGKRASDIVIVDATQKKSASKRQ